MKPLRELNPVTPYYGLFIGDGDSMGKAIKNKDRDQHQAFSYKLSGFAKSANTVLGDGAIFAGGDDVMAFLPLHIALARMREVRKAFAVMQPFGVTFSAGLAICHSMESLAQVRKLATAAESEAKKFKDKDAICITVAPRSGADVSVVGKWTLIDDLEEIATLYIGNKLTLSLAHEFQSLLDEWKTASESTKARLDQRLPALAAAIASKKDSHVEAVRLVRGHVSPDEPRTSLEYLTQCLYVARPFARAMKEALPES